MREEYNQRTDFEMSRIRDFIILHYHANGRTGEPFWDEIRNVEIPETLKGKLDLFRATGGIFREGDELFDVPGWVQVMVGQNVLPDQWHPIADQVAVDKLKLFLDAVEQSYVRDSGRMPEHATYLSRFAPMPDQQVPAGASA